jgi:hypothetical protein
MRENRMGSMTGRALTEVTFVPYASHVTHQGLTCEVFEPENDTFVIISKVVTELVVSHELQR